MQNRFFDVSLARRRGTPFCLQFPFERSTAVSAPLPWSPVLNDRRLDSLSLTEDGLVRVATERPAMDVADNQAPRDNGLLLRQAAERGHTDIGWLSSFHSFSFGGYYDQRHMGFRSLQVARGELVVNGTTLRSGDAVATSRETDLHAFATETTDALLFDRA